jgi:hypothetical protein
MLLAVVAGTWGYLVAPSNFVFVLAALAAVVGVAGIVLLGINYFSHEGRTESDSKS